MSKQIIDTDSRSVLRLNAQRFAALADEQRLQILVKLGSDGPMSIKQLAVGFPVTRQAVTKHLRVLEEAKFVSQRTEGRERRFRVRPSEIRKVSAALDAISQQWDSALLRLKHFVESDA